MHRLHGAAKRVAVLLAVVLGHALVCGLHPGNGDAYVGFNFIDVSARVTAATVGRPFAAVGPFPPSGDIVCIWDDDDLHHPHRIATQLSAMTGAVKE